MNQVLRPRTTIAGLGPHGELGAPADLLLIDDRDAERAQRGHFSIAIVVHTTRLDGTALQVKAIGETLARHGATIEEVVECGFDPQRQNRELERLARSRPSAVISLPLGGAVTVEAHRGLARAGVRVVLMDNMPAGLLPSRDYVSVVSADNFGLGEVGAELLSSHIPAGGCVAMVGYDVDFFVTAERELGFRKWMRAKRPDVRVVPVRFPDPSDAPATAAAVLEAEPGLAGLFVVWDEPAMAVMGALRAAGRPLPMTTVDLGAEAAADLAAGGMLVGIGAQRPWEQGIAEATAALLALIGREPPSWVALPALPVTGATLLDAYRTVWRREPPPSLVESRRASGGPDTDPRSNQGPGDDHDDQGVPILELRDVDTEHLRGITFALYRGEVVGLVGPRAGGRAELLEVILGLRPVGGGSLLVDGVTTSLRSLADAAASGIGYPGTVPSDLAADDVSGDLVRRARLEVIRRTAAPGPRTIAGGEGPAALPRLLVLDEPFAGLAPADRLITIVELRAIAGAGSAVVIGSPDEAALAESCDRLIRLDPSVNRPAR